MSWDAFNVLVLTIRGTPAHGSPTAWIEPRPSNHESSMLPVARWAYFILRSAVLELNRGIITTILILISLGTRHGEIYWKINEYCSLTLSDLQITLDHKYLSHMDGLEPQITSTIDLDLQKQLIATCRRPFARDTWSPATAEFKSNQLELFQNSLDYWPKGNNSISLFVVHLIY